MAKAEAHAAGKGLTVACVQLRAGIDRAENTDAALALIHDAADQGARFIVTPEMTNAVDKKPDRLRENLPIGEDLAEIHAFAAAAKARGVHLLAGSFAVRLNETMIANRAYLFAPDGAIAARYDKIHMFDVQLPGGETWRESAVYQPGERAVIADVAGVKTGLTICYDVRFPALYRRLAQAGAALFCVPAAFTAQTGAAHWEILLRARAIENGAFVVAAGQGGRHADGRDTYGHSMIIGPWGETIAALDHDAPGVLVAEIDPEAAAEARRRIPNLTLERAPELVTLGS